MELFTYKFSVECPYANTYYLQSKGWQKYYLKKEFLTSYGMEYDIAERKRMSDYSRGWGRNKTYFKKEVNVDWRDTIFNIKVVIPKDRKAWPKITFKVKLTPKEAYLLGKAFEESSKPHFYNVSYKKVEKGQHGC